MALGDLAPGDIIQFNDCKFVHSDRSWYTLPLHTAIVVTVKGSVVTFISQNFQSSGEDNEPATLMRVKVTSRFPGLAGRDHPIDLAENREGTLKYYRPSP
jgi:hypothetical protein